ncbi:hypothetical protein [Embleya hyalina]|uniref:Uncharacterized protein n=1 Tax=Embleya hyalina TaxID=516124 RepID=A0A401Z4M8_9ACTN|nr:hypothetical protein [Embleya hyalina]GCE01800.1 hypothetical protein EHYA_09574 [Embleya hyalina]
MTGAVVRDADRVLVSFTTTPGLVVIAPPGLVVAPDRGVTVAGRPPCLSGDEKDVSPYAEGVFPYTRPPYVVPGFGRISLNADAVRAFATVDGRQLLLNSGKFAATFTILVRATKPPPQSDPDDDMNGKYEGDAVFLTDDITVTCA